MMGTLVARNMHRLIKTLRINGAPSWLYLQVEYISSKILKHHIPVEMYKNPSVQMTFI